MAGQKIYEAKHLWDTKWQVIVIETFIPKTCEYGCPELCGKPAFMRTPYGHMKFPGELYSCEEHFIAMSSGPYGRAVEVVKHHDEKKGIKTGGLVELAF